MTKSALQQLKEHQAIELKVAELEDELATLKSKRKVCKTCGGHTRSPESERLTAVKHELREWRAVLRLGRPEFAVATDDSGEPIVDSRGEPVRVLVHNGYNIVDGKLVEKKG